MKSTKNTKVKPAASAQEEECGIWLDTKELKEKKQQKQLTRPISKFLNPLARSGGYSVAVALSFTQTKLNMPVTKQSTISTFFSPKSRGKTFQSCFILPVNENHKRWSASVNTNKNQEQPWHKNKASPMKRMGKENSWPASPVKNAPTSPFKRHLISSPAKYRLNEKNTFPLIKSGKELANTETAGETLFTQDSEGFCVIAHRDRHLRSPLRDQSNLSVGKDYGNSPSAASLEKEEEESDLEPEMLFTQDSEGNMVIKH
uniref:Si:ch1073-228h2.2 n=1 Tax=Cyprinus carpio TaxID=7962 RepID=A0A8C1GG86_CYPCA